MPWFAQLSTKAVYLCAAATAIVVNLPTWAQSVESSTVDRAYGYFVGDVVVVSHHLTLPASTTIATDSLPPAGRDGGWFELLRREVKGTQLVMAYQVTNAPKAVRVAFTPKHTVKALTGAQTTDIVLPSLAVAISPLSLNEAFDRAGMEAMRPDRATPVRGTAATSQRLALWAGLALFGGLYLAHLRFGPFWGRRGLPFAASRRPVRKALRSQTVRDAIRSLHTAFDATAQRAVFATDVERFLQRHPHFAALRADIDAFFSMSQGAFFGGDTQAPANHAWLAAFADRMAHAEASA
jgi:mxaA protein